MLPLLKINNTKNNKQGRGEGKKKKKKRKYKQLIVATKMSSLHQIFIKNPVSHDGSAARIISLILTAVFILRRVKQTPKPLQCKDSEGVTKDVPT